MLTPVKRFPYISADLGFEDCSARVIEADGLSQAAPYVAKHQSLTPKDWAFYSFNVTDDDYQVVVNVDSENNTECASCDRKSKDILFVHTNGSSARSASNCKHQSVTCHA